MEHVDSEMKKLNAERREINLDREKRDCEWAELRNSIEELKAQREKLEKQREINLDREKRDCEWAELRISIEELKVQREKLEKLRELLRADRVEILAQIEKLKKIEDLKDKLDSIDEKEMRLSTLEENIWKSSAIKVLKPQNELLSEQNGDTDNGVGHGVPAATISRSSSTPISAPFSWLKRCADSLLEQRQSSKRRRKENGMTTQLGIGATTLSSEKKVGASKGEQAIITYDQMQVNAEVVGVCVDKNYHS